MTGMGDSDRLWGEAVGTGVWDELQGTSCGDRGCADLSYTDLSHTDLSTYPFKVWLMSSLVVKQHIYCIQLYAIFLKNVKNVNIIFKILSSNIH